MPARRNLIQLLGLTSFGLGVFDCFAADTLAEKTGMRDARIYRFAGAREIVSGAAIALFPAHPAPIVARLLGDAMDIAILSAVAARPDNKRRFAALIGVGLVVAISVADAVALSAQRAAASKGETV